MATQVFITDEGRAALLLGPVILGDFKLGDAYNYTPGPSDTDIRGSLVKTGATSAPVVTYTNLYNYTIDLPADEDITFGEIGLFFPNGDLFALYAFEDLIEKTADPADLDGSGGTIHFFVPTSGDSVADLNEGELLGQITTVDDLPRAAISPKALYTVVHPVHTPVPVLAFKLYDLWGISNYTQQHDIVITSAGLNRITTTGNYQSQQGDIAQFLDGPYKGICRKILSAHYTPNETTFVFVTPLSGTPPAPGTKVAISSPFSSGSGGSSLPSDISSLALLRDGSVVMAGTFNMGGHSLTNLAAPLSPTDAATKSYVDALVASISVNTNYVLRDGTTAMLAPFNFGGYRGLNLGAPQIGSDAATKDYVDSVVSTGGLPQGPINQNNQRIINLGTPTLATDAATKGYVDSALTNYLPRNGSQGMTGQLSMSSYKIINVGMPTNLTDGANKEYVDIRTQPRWSTFTGVSGSRTFSVTDLTHLNVVVNGNTSITFTGGIYGQRFTVKLTQDASASRTVSFTSAVRFSQDIPSYTLVTTANRSDLLGFFIDSDSGGSLIYRLVAVIQGFQ